MNNKEEVVLKKEVVTEYAYIPPEKADGKVFLPAVNAVMFEVMFNNTKRKKYVAFILSEILKRPFKEIYDNLEFEKDKLDKDNYFEKGETVDLICKLDDIIYNVEMNSNPNISALIRNIVYATTILKQKSKKNDRGYNYNDVISINLNNFSFKGDDRVMVDYALRDALGEMLTDKIKIVYITLPKIREKYYNKEELSPLEKFLVVINEGNRDGLEEIMKENKIMEDYRRDAERASSDEEIVGLYNKKEDEERIHLNELDRKYEEGIKDGFESGIKEGKLDMLKNMIQKKLDDKYIMSIAEINEEELNKIKGDI